MEGEAVPVVAEWALWGARYGGGPGYRLLEFSEGAIPRDVFVEVILRRFLTDAVDQPQVIIGGFSPGANGRYLGIAINDRDERAPDSAGRPAMLTSFYCVPFDQLAAGSVSYQAMYERFRDSPLPVAGQRPIQTSLAGAPQGLRPPRLALQAAAELLTGTPVCILGAEHVPLRERLRFLDTVTALLPYGMRSYLSAATRLEPRDNPRLFARLVGGQDVGDDPGVNWLFFSDDDLHGIPIRTLHADRPSDGHPDDHSAALYWEWLSEDVPGRMAQLAALTDEQGFGRRDVDRLLALLDDPRWREAHSSDWVRERALRPEAEPPAAPRPSPPLQPRPSASESVASRRRWRPLFRRWLDFEAAEPDVAGLRLTGDRISRVVRSMVQQGLVVFNPPEEMWQGRKARIEVGIARSAAFQEMLVKGLRGHGVPQFQEIDTTSVMSVELKGGDKGAFEITAHSAAEQVVAPAARWEFDVLPIRAGMQSLILSICLRLTGAKLDALGPGNSSVPVLERPIRIHVNVSYSTRRFVAGNWQWLTATAAGLGGGIAAWINLVH